MSKSTDVTLLSPRLVQLAEKRGMVFTTDQYGNPKLGFSMATQRKVLAKFLGLTENEFDAIPLGLRLQENAWELMILKLLMEK